MKEQIIKLRQEGKSYTEIKKILGCSTSTIAYHCGKGQKEKRHAMNQLIRKQTIANLKAEHGNQCKICGYNKTSKALCFHHLNAKEKTGCVSQISLASRKKAIEEAKKCILICCNCHVELHEGVITL